jgi:hypothetical protein
MESMTPAQALAVVDSATSSLNGPRAAHLQMIAAIQVLKILVDSAKIEQTTDSTS